MGTRSIIAVPEGDGWVGRYCHWDGYPEGVGLSLVENVERLGLERVRGVIMGEPVGWSVVAGTDLSLDPVWDEIVVGAPKSFSARGETPRGDDADWGGDVFRPTDDDFGGAEFVHVLADDALWVIPGAVGAFGLGGGDFRLADTIRLPYVVSEAEKALGGLADA